MGAKGLLTYARSMVADVTVPMLQQMMIQAAVFSVLSLRLTVLEILLLASLNHSNTRFILVYCCF